MLNKEQIIQELNKFCEKYGVEKSEVEVFSGAALVLRGLRDYAADVDMYVHRETCQRLIDTGDFKISEARRGPQFLRFETDVLDIGDTRFFCDWICEGYNVQSLDSLLQLKLNMNRPKDQKDIQSLRQALTQI
ncbi:hypothetical protein [Burkholderia phage FLC6]|nr:hypothetical protein [Burkholderia phage FLC6]